MDRMISAAIALLLLLPAPTLGADIESIVGKTIEVYGGRERLSRALVLRETGKVLSSGRDGEGRLSRIYQRPDKLRIEIAYPGEATEVRILSGAKGWRQGVPSIGPPYDAMVLQAARIALPLNLLEGVRNLKDSGDSEREGKKVRVLELPLGEGMGISVEIDRETGYIVRTVGKSAAGAGAPAIEFAASYGDFRKVDGLLFAFRETNYAMGSHIGDTLLEKIEVLDRIDPGTFLPAGKEERR